MNIKQKLSGWLDQNQPMLTALSDQVWDFAELRYHETQSATLLANTLESAGFRLRRGVAEIPTAFVAEYGSGAPVIALLGEYDALPGLSQEALPYQQARQEGGSGHGCGHNLLGVGALGAALALKQVLDEGSTTGTIRFYGCPAEETGAAKAFMVKAGLFDDVDISLTWHPGAYNGVLSVNMLARIAVYFRFKGKTAHAASDPYNGRSALDAVELMNVGVNYLREHIIPEARLHYVITNGGGSSPNVVPASAESLFYIRAPRGGQVREILERVQDVARGAAQMTGTESEMRFYSACSNLVLNDILGDLFHAEMVEIGAPHFDEAEKDFANQVALTLPQDAPGMLDDFLAPNHMHVLDILKQQILAEEILPVINTNMVVPGSTDVGDVSWVTPTAQFWTTCYPQGSPGHSWQITAAGGMSIGHKGMLYAAKILAFTALDLMIQPDLVEKARQEFAKRKKGTPYISPIPDGTQPPIDG